MKPIKIALGVAAFASLTACGLKGDLERPAPIFRDNPEPVMTPSEPPVIVETEEEDVPDDELLGGPEG